MRLPIGLKSASGRPHQIRIGHDIKVMHSWLMQKVRRNCFHFERLNVSGKCMILQLLVSIFMPVWHNLLMESRTMIYFFEVGTTCWYFTLNILSLMMWLRYYKKENLWSNLLKIFINGLTICVEMLSDPLQRLVLDILPHVFLRQTLLQRFFSRNAFWYWKIWCIRCW